MQASLELWRDIPGSNSTFLVLAKRELAKEWKSSVHQDPKAIIRVVTNSNTHVICNVSMETDHRPDCDEAKICLF